MDASAIAPSFWRLLKLASAQRVREAMGSELTDVVDPVDDLTDDVADPFAEERGDQPVDPWEPEDEPDAWDEATTP